MADTDADGLTDGEEVLTHGSSPLLADTDGDTIDDATEVADNGDPNNPSNTGGEVVGPTITILGTGTGALLGGDLTDPEDDGDEAAGETDPSWNWVSITSNNEPGFEGGEFSFNIFDNQLGGGNAKWCCDDPTPDAPHQVTVEFANAVSLTHFTVASANDVPGRDPTWFEIQGSNDGENFTPIFTQNDPEALWDERLQVVLIELAEAAPFYTFIRLEIYDTPEATHQIAEIEYFGTIEGGGGEPEPDGDLEITGFEYLGAAEGANLTFTSEPGTAYEVQVSRFLNDFSRLQDATGAEGATSTTVNVSSGGLDTRFFRIIEK